MVNKIKESYNYAREKYNEIGVDTDDVLNKLEEIKVSLNCWQGDDIHGFLKGEDLSGGIAVTGNYLGRAKNIFELQNDLEIALSLIVGNHKVSLHSIYADTSKDKDLLEIKESDFDSWIDWAKKNNLGLDFNPTLFSHPKADTGFTLSSNDKEIRDYWIEHVKQSRKISEYIGKELEIKSINNIWIPDGYKDDPIDRLSPRKRLLDSLDKARKEFIDPSYSIDAVEGKLFGIGAESYTTGTHEFYLSYALTRDDVLWTIDSGHFHPTENVADKIATVAAYNKDVYLHLSRPVRWDSDHVVKFNDDLNMITQTVVNNGLINNVYIGLDFFDATINRIAAWVIGTRNVQKSLLFSMLAPIKKLKDKENDGDYTYRLAMTEELKSYPFGAVWDYFCFKNDVPVSIDWINIVSNYEKNVLKKR